MITLPSFDEFINEKFNSWDPQAIKLLIEFCKELSFNSLLAPISDDNDSERSFMVSNNAPDKKTISNELKRNNKFQVWADRGDYYVAYKGNVFTVQPDKSYKNKGKDYVQITYFQEVKEWNEIANGRNSSNPKLNIGIFK